MIGVRGNSCETRALYFSCRLGQSRPQKAEWPVPVFVGTVSSCTCLCRFPFKQTRETSSLKGHVFPVMKVDAVSIRATSRDTQTDLQTGLNFDFPCFSLQYFFMFLITSLYFVVRMSWVSNKFHWNPLTPVFGGGLRENSKSEKQTREREK